MPDANDIKNACILLALAVIISLVFNHFSPHGIALKGQWEESQGVVSAMSKNQAIDSGIEIHHPKRIEQIIAQKQRILMDVRIKAVYNDGHIPGALSYPLADFDENFISLVRSVKKTDPILVYCSSIQCTDSHTFAQLLIQSGYSDVKVFPGGFRQWEELGYPIEKNENHQ